MHALAHTNALTPGTARALVAMKWRFMGWTLVNEKLKWNFVGWRM